MIRAARQARTVRCAIYTRKSTEEGLEQEFNSLDAQREAAESYIASQKAARWRCLPERYDDGGYSGGDTERPALRRLLADVEAGRIDGVVVYKVDRLSRSLFDFARIMDLLERHEVFFISVTQPFNTSHSMGRLTLNTLLAFAQFEREIISERTRDKIAAARRKGKWSGGRPVLGYDVAPGGGKLVVNEEEAARVRVIYALFLAWKAILPVLEELDRRKWTNKRWVTQEGCLQGGKPFDRVSLRTLLGNVLYIGKVAYKGETHDGEHPPIVERDVFEQVQALLKVRKRAARKRPRNSYDALLGGLVYCASCGRIMGHTYTDRKGRRYRYYLCQNVQKGGRHRCRGRSIPAPKIENFVVGEVRRLGNNRVLLAEELKRLQLLLPPTAEEAIAIALQRLDIAWDAMPPREQSRVIHLVVEKVSCDVAAEQITITFNLSGLVATTEETTGGGEPEQWAAAGDLTIERETSFGHVCKVKPQPAGRLPRVSRIMALAIKCDGMVRDGAVAGYGDIARLGHVTRARVTQIMNLLYLAPDIQEDVLFLPRVEKGRDPFTERDLRRIAAVLDWRTQRRMWKEMRVLKLY